MSLPDKNISHNHAVLRAQRVPVTDHCHVSTVQNNNCSLCCCHITILQNLNSLPWALSETVHKEQWKVFSFSLPMAVALSLVTAGINMCREGVELKPPNKTSLAYKMLGKIYKEKANGWNLFKVFSITKQSKEWYYGHFFPGIRWAQWEPSELFSFPSIFPLYSVQLNLRQTQMNTEMTLLTKN